MIMISDPSMMIHIDPKCPDSNQTPPSLLRLLKKKGASFSTTSIAAPAMMPVFKPSEIEHIEMTKPKLNKGRNFPCRKWRHIMSYSCNFLTSFGTCSNLFCKTSSSTSSSRLRQVDGHRSHRSRGAMNQRFGVDESTTGGVDNPRVHSVCTAFRHSARRFQIFRGKGFTKISWNIIWMSI